MLPDDHFTVPHHYGAARHPTGALPPPTTITHTPLPASFGYCYLILPFFLFVAVSSAIPHRFRRDAATYVRLHVPTATTELTSTTPVSTYLDYALPFFPSTRLRYCSVTLFPTLPLRCSSFCSGTVRGTLPLSCNYPVDVNSVRC